MGLTVSRKTPNYLAVWRKNWQILTVSRKKKLTVKNMSDGNNGKVLTVSRKLAKILIDSRKSHHPIETLESARMQFFVNNNSK